MHCSHDIQVWRSEETKEVEGVCKGVARNTYCTCSITHTMRTYILPAAVHNGVHVKFVSSGYSSWLANMSYPVNKSSGFLHPLCFSGSFPFDSLFSLAVVCLVLFVSGEVKLGTTCSC